MSADDALPSGLYERLLDDELEGLLAARPDLTPIFQAIDDESSPQTYSQFLWHVIRRALPIAKHEHRLAIANRLVELLSAEDGLEYTRRKILLQRPKTLLHEILAPGDQPRPRPSTPLSVSSLFTGHCGDPQLEHELRAEMMTADRVDILVSFVKFAGLRLLRPAFENLVARKVPVRIITTSYMGASDPLAVEWLAQQPGFSVRVSYDTERTRLHAKAYHFVRASGFSTAYIGSANMSRAAMTSGLEWTVKVTAQDMPHILARFAAEFEGYWAKDEFVPFDAGQAGRFRDAIAFAKRPADAGGPRFFADIRPHPFQDRILDALAAERAAGSFRNLVVAATGTGKTVMAAFDYARFRRANPERSRLLFVAHRKEILTQALDCFRTVLRDQNLGELLVDGSQPVQWEHVFASVQSLTSQRPWEHRCASYFDYVVVDEAHHGLASTYRPLFDHLQPAVLLGLTATPERMDGSSILSDFGHRFAAEIRLPEALEEKLLCPFHYFGISDPVAISDERFWRNGKFDEDALTEVYTADDLRARQRLDVILDSLERYQPDRKAIRGVGFCASVKHARFMAEKFREAGRQADVVLGDTPMAIREERIRDFRQGRLHFLFTVDVVSEGVDIPDINVVLFLRPTESLTVFLQQLGRGLRHAPEKDCLTVLDFVGQSHRRYRLDRKFSALLRTQRGRIDKEIERDFPNLPPGCSIQLERVARAHILNNIRESLGNLSAFIPEAIRTFEAEVGTPLNFAKFVEATGLMPLEILRNRTWSEWKASAYGQAPVADPDLKVVRSALRRVSLRTDVELLDQLRQLSGLPSERTAEEQAAYGFSNEESAAIHYLLWGKKGTQVGVRTYQESFNRWRANEASNADLQEIVEWRKAIHPYPTQALRLPGGVRLRLHAAYGLFEIKAAFGLADLGRSGSTGVGVIHIHPLRVYLHLVTFKKEDRDFAPTTRYRDYLISRTQLHWESQAATTRASRTGQNYLRFQELGYTILTFARMEKRIEGETAPFVFLGPATRLISAEGDRPISMVWELSHPVPAELFEAARIA
ncbi:MAG: DUF3427 domain-containing protein [Chthoniobacteraceae bacterium]